MVLFIFMLIHILATIMHVENNHIVGASINYLFTYGIILLYRLIRYFPICALFLVQFLQAIKFGLLNLNENCKDTMANSFVASIFLFFCKKINQFL